MLEFSNFMIEYNLCFLLILAKYIPMQVKESTGNFELKLVSMVKK